MKWAVRPIVLLTHVLGACASTGSGAPQGATATGEATSEAPAAREPDRQASREESAEGRAIAKQFLGDRPGGAWSGGAEYEWLTAGRLYWVMGPGDPGVLVAVPGDGRGAVRLTGDIPALKGFLAKQFNGRLPGVSALSGIARLVKDAIIGKGGSIATPEFFESQHHLDAWLKGRERDPDKLKRLCSGIRTSLNKNEWTVEFNVINGGGGVDVVRASGTASPLALLYINVEVVKARGEFNYPLDG